MEPSAATAQFVAYATFTVLALIVVAVVAYWLIRVLVLAPPAPLERLYDVFRHRATYDPAHAAQTSLRPAWVADFPALR